jgi:hypothetical protein
MERRRTKKLGVLPAEAGGTPSHSVRLRYLRFFV